MTVLSPGIHICLRPLISAFCFSCYRAPSLAIQQSFLNTAARCWTILKCVSQKKSVLCSKCYDYFPCHQIWSPKTFKWLTRPCIIWLPTVSLISPSTALPLTFVVRASHAPASRPLGVLLNFETLFPWSPSWLASFLSFGI